MSWRHVAGQLGLGGATNQGESMMQLPGVGWRLLAAQAHHRERKRSSRQDYCCQRRLLQQIKKTWIFRGKICDCSRPTKIVTLPRKTATPQIGCWFSPGMKRGNCRYVRRISQVFHFLFFFHFSIFHVFFMLSFLFSFSLFFLLTQESGKTSKTSFLCNY